MKNQLYLLVGDAFLRQRKREEIIKTVSSKEEPAVHSHYASDFDPQKFMEDVQTYPFLASRQVLLLKDVDRLSKSSRELLMTSLRVPPFSTVILEADQMDSRDSLWTWAAAEGQAISFAEARQEEADQFVRSFLRQKGKSISPEAFELLRNQTGGSLAALSESLEKLVLHSPGKEEIQGDAVIALSEKGGSFDNFDLINAFSRKDVPQALKVLTYLIEELGSEPVEILGTLNWHFKRVWQAQDMLAEGRLSHEIARELRLPRFVQEEFLKQVKRFPRKKMREIVEGLFQIDRDVKRGMVEPQLALETFLVRFAG